MGFIENILRRKAEEKVESEREAEIGRENYLRRQDEEEARRERIKMEREQAKGFFEQSNFPSLMIQMILVEKDRKIRTEGYEKDEWYQKFGISEGVEIHEPTFLEQYVSVEVKWGIEDRTWKKFKITCDPSGTIKVDAGWKKSASFASSKWLGNYQVQDQILEQAYLNPELCRVQDSTSVN